MSEAALSVAPQAEEKRPRRELFDYWTEAEVEEVRELSHALAREQEGLLQITIKQGEVDRELTALAARRARNVSAAAARALGEAVTLPPAPAPVGPPVDRAELEDSAVGLRERQRLAEDSVRKARTQLRAKTAAVVRAAVERAAVDYVEAADRTYDLWKLIAAAQHFSENVVHAGGACRAPVAPWDVWQKLCIPGSGFLEPLRKRTREFFGMTHIIHFGETDSYPAGTAGGQRLARDFEAEIGPWPFDRK